MKTAKIVIGYILIAFPPVYALYLLINPEAFFYKNSPSAPYVVATTMLLVLFLALISRFGYYLLKSEKGNSNIK